MKIKIKINSELANQILFEDLDPKSNIEIIKRGDWVSGGKYETKTTIFKKDDKFYRILRSRSGSHFTEYVYDSEYQDEFECTQVEPVEVTVTEWKPVNVENS